MKLYVDKEKKKYIDAVLVCSKCNRSYPEDEMEEPESETTSLDAHEVKDRVLPFIQKNSDRDGEISNTVLKENFTPEELDLMRETGYIYEPIIGKVKAT